MRPRQVCAFLPSADLAGRAVAFSADIPTVFDQPLAAHHKLIGRWVSAREEAAMTFTRAAARRHIERVFDAAVMEILASIESVDLRVAVLGSEEENPPAIAIICETLGQLDLGWIEASDAPTSWRAAAYRVLEQKLGLLLPIFGYDDLFEQIAMYYWDGHTDDGAARESLIYHYGVDGEELDELTLPSELNARRPDWMIAANAAPRRRLPIALRRKLDALDRSHQALAEIDPERNAWTFDYEAVCDYIPGIEECSSLPPLTLVPFEHFTRELDEVARHGMEMSFMDIAGLCPLSDASQIDDWFTSLRLGAQFLACVQDLIQFDPTKWGGRHVRP
ncbi:hypothetical protein [Sphingobium fuliginis]|uniref:PRTRC system protein F n=1 Tax=Sphingobium fuliginis (strain ATCC 27551) TaxID=336203 RepID=A0A292ZNA9_SPHSA|nr:hypothetical protein [Sphingobium fuliginis]GAY24369.1 hypothetical protein SFOMI_4949 [Sphingobium fuliginis]